MSYSTSLPTPPPAKRPADRSRRLTHVPSGVRSMCRRCERPSRRNRFLPKKPRSARSRNPSGYSCASPTRNSARWSPCGSSISRLTRGRSRCMQRRISRGKESARQCCPRAAAHRGRGRSHDHRTGRTQAGGKFAVLVEAARRLAGDPCLKWLQLLSESASRVANEDRDPGHNAAGRPFKFRCKGCAIAVVSLQTHWAKLKRSNRANNCGSRRC